MTNHLRTISLYVDEPDAGRFHWVLIESSEDASVWTEHSASKESHTRWLDALNAGVAELRRLAQDDKWGPRATGESEDADPVG